MRALAPFIAGSSGMQYRAFVPYSVLGTGLWAATFSLLGYFVSRTASTRRPRSRARGRWSSATLVAIVVGVVVVSRYLREPENRERVGAADRVDRRGSRRLLPQVRFLWRRITPGGLGLEFTTPDGGPRGVAVRARRLRDRSSPTTRGRRRATAQAIDVVDALRADWLTDLAKVVTALGSTAVHARRRR